MKKMFNYFTAIGAILLSQVGCGPGIQESNIPDESTPETYLYSVSVSAATNTNAPALQSFAHGTSGSKVLLFAGRTNTVDSLVGGMHNMNGNYAQTSFIPKSYNTNIYVYDFSNQSVASISYSNLLDSLVNHYCPAIVSDSSGNNNNSDQCVQYFSENLETIFKATNPVYTQDGETLYVLGGYGAVPNDPNAYYITYNQIAAINIPKMISLIENSSSAFTSASDWDGLLKLGQDPTNTIISTGAEMFKIGDSIYLAGGHNFGNNQKYLDAVYPFAIMPNAAAYKLDVAVGKAISDVANPKAVESDDHSNFRRRDGPVIPALFKNPTTNEIDEGFTFYAGVFKPSPDTHLLAWNDAIYVHPTWSDTAYYTNDTALDQSNHNLYACAQFAGYDSTSGMVHTFLLGGIGTGTDTMHSRLSGFTNNGMHLSFNMATMLSTPDLIPNVFPGGDSLIYGAESTLILNPELVFYTASSANETDIINLATAFGESNTIDVGYVYGGIEAYTPNPGTYGVVSHTTKSGKTVKQKMSGASNKVWKVTLTRTAQ